MGKNKNFATLLVAVTVIVLGWTSIVGYQERQIKSLRKEVVSLKAEITATRTAIDSAAIFAEKHDGRVVTYFPVEPKLSPSPDNFQGVGSSVKGIVIRIEAVHHDYPTKEFVVGRGGDVNDITYNDDGSVISNHAGNWGTFSKWRR